MVEIDEFAVLPMLYLRKFPVVQYQLSFSYVVWLHHGVVGSGIRGI